MKKQVHIQVFFHFMKYPQVFFEHAYFLCIIMKQKSFREVSGSFFTALLFCFFMFFKDL